MLSLSVRAAERLMMRIQKEYWRPQQELMDLQKTTRRALLSHSSRLLEAKDLVNEAKTNTNETKRLLFLINSNLIKFNVRLDFIIDMVEDA